MSAQFTQNRNETRWQMWTNPSSRLPYEVYRDGQRVGAFKEDGLALAFVALMVARDKAA